MKRCLAFLVIAGLIYSGLDGTGAREAQGGKNVDTRVFELRTYYANPGKMDALHARFRDHTNKLFVKHGMTLIGYWNPMDAKEAQEKLIYILAFPSKEAAAKSWKDFQNDPDWKAAKAKSEIKGQLVAKVVSVYMNPTDYSPIK
jgi:NIPSNAP